MLRFTLLVMLSMMSLVGLAADRLIMEGTTFSGSGSKMLIVKMESAQPYVAFQFDLRLPEGVSLQSDACTLGSRFATTDHTLMVAGQSDDTFRIMVMSYTLTVIPDAEGDVLRMPVVVDESFVEGTAAMSNILMVTSLSESTTPEDASFVLSLQQDSKIYIETDLTAHFPADYAGWEGATGYTSVQFAPMVTTNDGRTVQVCEKYEGASATQGLVFRRLLTGLASGTYCIELYGAASSTKGRDTWIDSDMSEADEGNETAVYLYARTANSFVQQYIPVHWATSFSEVSTAVLNEVKVTDGTVEIGMYSERKFTNWHVIQVKAVTALVDAVELHSSVLSSAQTALTDEAYQNVTGDERTALSQAISTHFTVPEPTAEAYQTAIGALTEALSSFHAAKDAYDEWVAARALCSTQVYPYASAEKRLAAQTAAAQRPETAAACVDMTARLLLSYRQYAESGALLESEEGAIDRTPLIVNTSADEDIDNTVWKTVRGDGSEGDIGIRSDEPWIDGSGQESHRYFDGGGWNFASWNVTFCQEVTLPSGRYLLTAMGRSAQETELTLFADEHTADMAHTGSTGGLFGRGWEQTSVEFTLQQAETVTIGCRGIASAQHNWMSFSAFRLVQFPGDVPTGITGTERGRNNTVNQIYDLQGRKINRVNRKGLYIINGRKVKR